MTKGSNVETEMIGEFQCPGCVHGCGVMECASFNLIIREEGYFYCDQHYPATTVLGVRTPKICLGLPRGFNRSQQKNSEYIRLWYGLGRGDQKSLVPVWDQFNVAVWAMEKDGYLFVRTFSPRIDVSVVEVVKGGTLNLVPKAVDVSSFWGEID